MLSSRSATNEYTTTMLLNVRNMLPWIVSWPDQKAGVTYAKPLMSKLAQNIMPTTWSTVFFRRKRLENE